jgi:hypothetical protein
MSLSVSALLVELVLSALVVLLLAVVLSLELEAGGGGGGGGGAFCDPPRAWAKSEMSGRSPDVLAVEKSSASWVSWLAASVSPSVVAAAAASFKFSPIFDMTDLYSAGSDC